jgi:hypothetical protein
VQDKLGHRRSTVLLLGVWIFSALTLRYTRICTMRTAASRALILTRRGRCG